ncbi:TPA: hypothetical protein EYO12_02110 [Candidatus Saccharibacteria bacterium]|nr:hypothetical protein [Candidatus Saccharibacteria bacterium]HIO87511.1 hypothetical protein [Candidatus Saccharibacteria bacterium]
MVLLLQFRSDAAGWHELKCFCDALELPYHQIQTVNLLNPNTDWQLVRKLAAQSDKIIIGGSGETGYEHPDHDHYFAMLDSFRPFLAEQVDKGKHIFGVCLGHQILGDVFGGNVQPSPKHEETGTVQLEQSAAARNDPLFSDLPETFFVSTAHKTSVLSVPNHVEVLATNHNSPIQAMRYKNAWGVQYHPELDDEKLTFRLKLYQSYVRNQIDDVEPKDFSAAKEVLKRFIHLPL